MITPKDIKIKTMTAHKKASAKNDIFAYYIGRPLSYILTIPFLYTKITPNIVSALSIVPLIIGFLIMYVAKDKSLMFVGWLGFFLWNLLDGVDGNIARYKKEFSRMGEVWDAMAGYIAMILSFFGWGIAAAHNPGWFQNLVHLQPDIYIILGALSGFFVIFPRFIMHKALNTLKDPTAMNSVKDKSKYNFIEVVALNLVSISGFVQVFMLLAIVLNGCDLFTVVYFILNLLIMIVALKSIFSD